MRKVVISLALLGTLVLGACSVSVNSKPSATTTTFSGGSIGSNTGSTGNTGNSGSSGSTGNTGTSSLSTWFVGAKGDLTQLENDLGTVGTSANTAANTGDLAPVISACQSIQSDVTSLQNDGPVPDPTIEQHWSAALSDYNAGATACVSGANQNDVGLSNQASTDFQNGTSEVNAATAAIKASQG